MIEARVVWSANTPPHKDNYFPSLCIHTHSINNYSFSPRRDIKTEDVAIIKGIIGRG